MAANFVVQPNTNYYSGILTFIVKNDGDISSNGYNGADYRRIVEVTKNKSEAAEDASNIYVRRVLDDADSAEIFYLKTDITVPLDISVQNWSISGSDVNNSETYTYNADNNPLNHIVYSIYDDTYGWSKIINDPTLKTGETLTLEITGNFQDDTFYLITADDFISKNPNGDTVETVGLDDLNETSDNHFVFLTPICFPKGTFVTCDQGDIKIEELNSHIHSIRNMPIVAITKSRPLQKQLVCIEAGALGKNIPSQTTHISKEHRVFYKKKMRKARDLVSICDDVKFIPYDGEVLYNILLDKHDKMLVHNLICETLDPNNIVGKICGSNYTPIEKQELCTKLSNIIRMNDIISYKKLYKSLH